MRTARRLLVMGSRQPGTAPSFAFFMRRREDVPVQRNSWVYRLLVSSLVTPLSWHNNLLIGTRMRWFSEWDIREKELAAPAPRLRVGPHTPPGPPGPDVLTVRLSVFALSLSQNPPPMLGRF